MSQIAITQKHPKYRVAELIRLSYGELNTKEGITALTTHCGLKNKRTVSEWIKIEAGAEEEINHLVMGKVLSFFKLGSISQLYTQAHKNLLNPNLKIVD
jgi:hypothetical protein